MKFHITTIAIVCTLLLGACSSKKVESTQMDIDKMLKQFSPTLIKYDVDLLDERQTQALDKIHQACVIMDDLFLKQMYSKNEEILATLENSTNEADKSILEYFKIQFGPFDRLNHYAPFYGSEQHPDGANFYPEDMSKEEFEKWITDHPEDRDAFISEFTMIRREGNNLIAIPYSEFFKEDLTKAAGLLREEIGRAHV